MSKEQNLTLDNFTGFNAATHDFFGDVGGEVVTQTADVVDKVLNDDPTNTITPAKDDKSKGPTADTHDFTFGEENPDSTSEDFDNATNEEEEEVVNEDGKPNPTPKTKAIVVSSKTTLDFLKAKGFVDYTLPDGKTELTEAEADDVLEDSWEASIDEALGELFTNIDPRVKDIVTTAKNGGDIDGLIKTLATVSSIGISKSTDMTQESNQILAVTSDLKELGYDNDYIEAHIETLKSTGKLGIMATKAFDKIVAKQVTTITQAAQAAAQAKETRKVNQRAYRESLATYLSENKVIKGITLGRADLQSLPAYISEPTVTLNSGETVTEMQRDLFALMNDKESLVILSKAMRGKKGKLDFSFLSNKAITDFSNEVRNNIRNTEDVPVTRSTSGSSRSGRSLADHF